MEWEQAESALRQLEAINPQHFEIKRLRNDLENKRASSLGD